MGGSWHIGVIGGSGLYQVAGLEDAQKIDVRSPFGEPSGPVTTGSLGGVRFTFLSRHGEGHRLAPSKVNFRANIDVLKRCGVTDLVSISAVGSLREHLRPGEFVAVDQIIDRTLRSPRSFLDDGLVGHVSLADPYCPRLSALAAGAAEAAGAVVHRGGCNVAIEGPQFSTRAESRMYRAWGADVIGMTAMPEARLAREAELPMALLCMVTDYDSWRDSEEAVDVAQVMAVMRANVGKARDTLVELARALPARRETSPIDRALDGAIMTAPQAISDQTRIRLAAVAGRVLPLSEPM